MLHNTYKISTAISRNATYAFPASRKLRLPLTIGPSPFRLLYSVCTTIRGFRSLYSRFLSSKHGLRGYGCTNIQLLRLLISFGTSCLLQDRT